MKALIAILATCTLGASAAEQFREFTASDGRKLKARVVSCDSRRGKAEIEREDGTVIVAMLSAFSPRDRDYILQWEPISLFMSPMDVPITLHRVEERKWKREHESSRGMQRGGGGMGGNMPMGQAPGGSGGGGPGGEGNMGGGAEVAATDKYVRYRFDVKIGNRGRVPLRGLEVEYCIFYDQDRAVPEDNGFGVAKAPGGGSRSGGGVQEFYMALPEKRVKTGKLSVPFVDPASRRVVSSERVTILNRNAGGDGEGELIDLDGELKGIWVKVYMMAPDGTRRVREVALPRHLPKRAQWKPAT